MFSLNFAAVISNSTPKAPISATGVANNPGHAEDPVVPDTQHAKSKDKTHPESFTDRTLCI